MGFWDKAKAQLKADFQKAKDAGQTKTIKLEFIGGFPGVKGKEIEIAKNMQTGETRVNGSAAQLLGIDWQESAKRSAGKAAAGAIVGGVLTGGVGLVAGAAIGGRRKDTSTAVVDVEVDGQAYSVYVRCSQDEFKDLSNFL